MLCRLERTVWRFCTPQADTRVRMWRTKSLDCPLQSTQHYLCESGRPQLWQPPVPVPQARLAALPSLLSVFNLPVNFLHPIFFQKGICLAEMFTPEKSSMCRQRTWMWCCQDQMFGVMKHRFFRLSRFAPQ